MLRDFLGERWIPDEIKAFFETMDDAPTNLERFEAFQAIVDEVKRIDPGCRRHKSVSDECMLLAMREMRDIVIERQPGMSLHRLIAGSRLFRSERPTSRPRLPP